jgi:hypothetical protein
VPEGRKEQVFGPRLLPKALLQGFYPGEMLVPIELELCNHWVRSPEDLADQRVGEYAELLHRRNLLEDEQIATGDQLAALLVPQRAREYPYRGHEMKARSVSTTGCTGSSCLIRVSVKRATAVPTEKTKSCATHKLPRCTGHQNGLISGTRGKERGLPFCWWASWSVVSIGGCALPGSRREEERVRRPRRKRLMSWRVIPVSARSAMTSPITLANL